MARSRRSAAAGAPLDSGRMRSTAAAAAAAPPSTARLAAENPFKRTDMGIPAGALMSDGPAAVAAALVLLEMPSPSPRIARRTRMGTRTGVSITGSLVYYAGGGGGSGNSSERGGDAYDGGGRGFGTTSYYDYLTYPVGTSPLGGSSTLHALPNTGGGGGASSYWCNNTVWGTQGSGAGGSGIVIVRYWIAQ